VNRTKIRVQIHARYMYIHPLYANTVELAVRIVVGGGAGDRDDPIAALFGGQGGQRDRNAADMDDQDPFARMFGGQRGQGRITS